MDKKNASKEAQPKKSPTSGKIKQPPKKRAPSKKVNITQPETFVNIDHPVTGEIIGEHHYTVRISTDADGRAEISINGGDWLPCRAAVGFWWYDWHHISSGSQKIAVRIIDSNGYIANKSKIVKFECR